jgi:Domain of unknown function (DUF4442)
MNDGGPAAPAPETGAVEGRRGGGRTGGKRHVDWRRRLLALLMNFYPPYLGAGIRVRLAPAASPAAGGGTTGDGAIEVRMGLHFWNRNIVGTHFGGSLYSMCDPFYMLILRQKLGPGYIVWDKSAAIRFRRPGRGPVSAIFDVPDEVAADIRARADQGETMQPTFHAEVTDRNGEVVAIVEKLLYVRRRPS